MIMDFLTIAAYQFVSLENLPNLKEQIKQKCLALELKGTVLLAEEGINCFLAGNKINILTFKNFLENFLSFKNLCYKEHHCTEIPFTRLLVKIKKEIISMGVPEIKPQTMTAPYLSPKELKAWMDAGKDFVLLDTRNAYEVSVGTFSKAVHLNINSFREFPKASQSILKDDPNKPIVLFCTGGIRCEKASALFIQAGNRNVFQLEGGILRYFEEFQGAHFQGNCFVFDWRLAVDSQLQPQSRSPEEPVNSGRHRLIPDPSGSSFEQN
jgi:UPF0176 protein